MTSLLSFNITVMLFMIVSAVILTMFAFGMSSNKIVKGKIYKIVLWIFMGLLLVLLFLTSLFVIG